jgi:hypothetical protein
MQLLLRRNVRLHVFPLMQQSITSNHLLVVTSDPNSIRRPRFRITRPPVLGRLLLEQADGSTQLVTSFTQRDLNQSLLIYEHTETFCGFIRQRQLRLRCQCGSEQSAPVSTII